MIFNEIYGTYYKVVAEIIDEALNGSLNEKRLDAIVSARAFSESILIIPEALKNGTWPLIDNNMQTPIRHSPSRPLTLLQKRWLKSLLTDPRISLFAPSCAGLEDIEPLLPSDRVVYFDAYTDGDPYGSPEYIGIFRTILKALHDGHRVEVYEELNGAVDYKKLLAKTDVFCMYTMTSNAPRAYELADMIHQKSHANCPRNIRSF